MTRFLCDLLCDLIDAEREPRDSRNQWRWCGRARGAVWQKTRYSPPITDVKLPGLNGIEVVQRLKQGRPEIKTLVLSGILNLGSIKRVLSSRRRTASSKSSRPASDEMRKALQAVAAG